MSWDKELAKQFKQRDNKIPVGAVLGHVIGINPLRVSIFQGKAILDNAYKCSKLNVELGDNVLCISDSTGQTFYIIDKVAK